MKTMKATIQPPKAGLYNGTWNGRRVIWNEPGEGRGTIQLWATVDEESPEQFCRVTVSVQADGIEVALHPRR